LPVTAENGEPIQLEKGDMVESEITEAKPDGKLTLKMPNGRQFFAEALTDRVFIPGQRVMLTVAEVQNGVPMVEITGERSPSAETFLTAMKAPITEQNLALAKEALIQQAPFTPRQFAALSKNFATLAGAAVPGRPQLVQTFGSPSVPAAPTPEQAVFMAKHDIPINRETVAQYKAVTQPQAQLGALLQKLLTILPPETGQLAQTTVARPIPVGEAVPGVPPAQPPPVPTGGGSPPLQNEPPPSASRPTLHARYTPGEGGALEPPPVLLRGGVPPSGGEVIPPQSNTPVPQAKQPVQVTIQPAPVGDAVPGAPQTRSPIPQPQPQLPQPLQAGGETPPLQQPPQPQQPVQVTIQPAPVGDAVPGAPQTRSPIPQMQTQTQLPQPLQAGGETPPLQQPPQPQQTVQVPTQPAPVGDAVPGAPSFPAQPEQPPPTVRELVEAVFTRVSPERTRQLPAEMDIPKQTKEIGRLITSVLERAASLPEQTRSEVLNTTREIVQTLRFTEQINHCASFAQLPVVINGERTTAQLYVFNDSAEKKRIDPQNATLFLSLSTANLGTVEGFVKIIGTGVEADFSLQTEEAASLFRAGMPELSELLEVRGYRLERVNAAVARAEPLPPAAVEKKREKMAGRYKFNRTV
jgi:hypothetical protein